MVLPGGLGIARQRLARRTLGGAPPPSESTESRLAAKLIAPRPALNEEKRHAITRAGIVPTRPAAASQPGMPPCARAAAR